MDRSRGSYTAAQAWAKLQTAAAPQLATAQPIPVPTAHSSARPAPAATRIFRSLLDLSDDDDDDDDDDNADDANGAAGVRDGQPTAADASTAECWKEQSGLVEPTVGAESPA